jgi:SAM-dependent methyltransferase
MKPAQLLEAEILEAGSEAGSEICRAAEKLLDEVYAKLLDREVHRGMDELVLGLRELRRTAAPGDWDQIARFECLAHPVRELIHQDPFTLRAFEESRGYPGDAELLDFIYSRIKLPSHVSQLGRELYAYTFQAPACQSVRTRRDLLASVIDEIAEHTDNAKVLSLACGHLREAQRSQAVADGWIEEFVGLDHDPASLAVVQREQAAKGIKTVQGSIKDLLARNLVFTDFDFVYSMGIYDYLAQPVAVELTNLIFTMLKPGGRFLVANFVPDLRDIGYMETFMDWRLIYRDETELEALASDLPPDRVGEKRTFRDSHQNLVFLEVVKQ